MIILGKRPTLVIVDELHTPTKSSSHGVMSAQKNLPRMYLIKQSKSMIGWPTIWQKMKESQVMAGRNLSCNGEKRMEINSENIMFRTGTDSYECSNGFTARRENGLTPNGNSIDSRWVLRDATGVWIDVNKYRHDLFEQNGLKY